MSFDSNAMQELRHVAADRYQRNGGGGAFKVYNSSKAYFDARGHNEQPAFARALFEARFRFQQTAATAIEQFRVACLTSKDGFYHGESIPF